MHTHNTVYVFKNIFVKHNEKLGPMKETVTHFWRMVWEYKIQAIVMLTRCFEMGKVSIKLVHRPFLYVLLQYFNSM